VDNKEVFYQYYIPNGTDGEMTQSQFLNLTKHPFDPQVPPGYTCGS